MTVRRRVMRLLALAFIGLSVACHGPDRTSPATALRTVTLPDTSQASPDVQSRLRERHATLTATIADKAASPRVLADAYGEMGKLFLAAEYFDAAEACFANAGTLAPSDMRWPYYLGHASRRANRLEQAEAAFARALALEPNHVPSLVWRAEMHLAANRPDAARQLLATAQTVAPRSGAVLYGLGRAALAMNDHQRAVTYLEEALTVAPTATRIHYPLAMAYRALGKRQQADAHLRQRGEVDPAADDPLMADVSSLLQNAAAYETRGQQALDARDWSEAVAQLSKAVEVAPRNAFTHLNLGTAFFMQGKADPALEQYREAIRLMPSLARAHFGIGVVMEMRGQDDAAIRAFNDAVTHDPAHIEARFSLANALRRSGRVDASLPHYAEVLRINPAVSQASFGYAMGLVRLGRYQAARDRLDRDVRAFPEQLGFAHALARLLSAAPDDRVRDGARANALMTKLLQDQRTPALAETMAMTQAELGKFDEAVKWQRMAIDLARQAGRAEMAPRLAEMLRAYEGGRPCRTPWANDDPVHHPRPQ